MTHPSPTTGGDEWDFLEHADDLFADPEFVKAMTDGTFDDEGWALDEDGNRYGHCNSCGEEAAEFADCCDDGEIWPYEGRATARD